MAGEFPIVYRLWKGSVSGFCLIPHLQPQRLVKSWFSGIVNELIEFSLLWTRPVRSQLLKRNDIFIIVGTSRGDFNELFIASLYTYYIICNRQSSAILHD